MSVPKIPDFFSSEYTSLINNLVNGTCMFLGAGVSKLVGYKIWGELCDSVIDAFWNSRNRLQKKNKKFTYIRKESLKSMKHTYPKTVLDSLYYTDKKLFENTLEKIFTEDERKEKFDVYEELAPIVRIKSNFFVQTNIDTSFQRYFNISDSDVAINPDFSDDFKKLNYLHGRLDKKHTWVFTTRQYFSNYLNENSKMFQHLVNLFKSYDVLFIGYSLRDFEVQQALGKVKLSHNKSNHHLLVAYDERRRIDLEIKEDIFKNDLGVHLIRYNIENDGPSLLLDVIKELNYAVKKDSDNIKKLGEENAG